MERDIKPLRNRTNDFRAFLHENTLLEGKPGKLLLVTPTSYSPSGPTMVGDIETQEASGENETNSTLQPFLF